MKKKAQKSPNDVKHDESHPTVSIRVTRELCDQPRDPTERSAKTLGDILREALEQQASSTEKTCQSGLMLPKVSLLSTTSALSAAVPVPLIPPESGNRLRGTCGNTVGDMADVSARAR